ncbi:hypothetical protein M422DRAFT_257318 [Sphaerobolus stellatus SS14]|uniref:Uncharacterized protein n=1 Tax=Sphaerobolus stellatus (strain SS14) TaxID=990650 RepID=A0A0C9VF40_SPHS4|nr:hypothetical protein M422DRAFT_257318 [Sphaerobolus stellatus SS14]
MSHATCSGNTAELLSRFREQQARRNEHRVEVGAVFEHLLEDIEQCPAKFSFSKDEIINDLHEAWPHVSRYISDLSEERLTLEKELDDEKADNRQLHSDMDDLTEKIQLEAQLSSLQPPAPSGDQSMRNITTTDVPSLDVGPHPLASPEDRTYSRKHPRKLLEDTNFQNRVQVPEKRPDYWSLYMWNTLKDWYTNPMSAPNAIRDDSDSYFLEEDIDVAAWISKISVDITRSAFMYQMKVVFGSCVNFDTAFSGFSKDLL